MASIKWEKVNANEDLQHYTHRAKIPGGWLVKVFVYGEGVGVTFVPDPNHEWP